MQSPENGRTKSRGTKRKLSSDGVKLTFAQRLAAARKVARHVEDDAEATQTDSHTNSSPKFLYSSEVEEVQDISEDIRRDDDFRSLYTHELDFASLASKDEDFQACLKGERYLDFTDPPSVMQLTKTLLNADFGLQIELPDDRLCPPVPNRHNYILWVKELLDSSSPSYTELYEPERKVMGLDIGTGASAIYPLLGCAQRPNWSFIATDIDAKSLSFARKNVELNDLESRIQVIERSVNDRLVLLLDDIGIKQIDFAMTNPPFYASASELWELAMSKAQPPNSACTGAPNEMVCEEGEIGFFKRIFQDSMLLRERVQWYTTMLGKQSSIEIVVETLRKSAIDNYAVAEFVQGNKTRRWAVGWSFANRRPSHKACRDFEPRDGKKLLPHPTEIIVASKPTRPSDVDQVADIFWTQLEDVTDGLDLVSWRLDEKRLRVVGFADQNVWGRAYRRSQARQKTGGDSSGSTSRMKPASCAFGFSIAVKTIVGNQGTDDLVNVVVRWLQGTDHSLFESFSGMLRNALLKVV